MRASGDTSNGNGTSTSELGRTARRRRRLHRVLAAALILLATAGLLATANGATAAPTDQQCSYANAGSGTYARTLCWLDMSGFDPAAAAAPGGQQMEVSLPGGYTLSYTISQTGRTLVPTAFPTFEWAFLGRSPAGYPPQYTGQYLGVAGRPALYQGSGTTNSSVTMSNIVVRDANGQPVTAFAIVGADAENTDQNESITWTSDKPLRQIAPLGSACSTGFTGVGTTSVRCSSGEPLVRSGVPMLAADSPTTMTQDLVSTQNQGVAFGILMSKVVLSKTVASRVSPSDSFGLSVTTADGIPLASADTGTASTATTGEVETIGASPTSPFTLAETATGTPLGAYSQSWSCRRNNAVDASLPSGAAGPSAQVTLGIGDLVACTITNTALPDSLSLTKVAGTVTDVNGNGVRDAGDTIPYTFVVTNTGALTMQNIAVDDPAAGAVTCPVTTLAPGAATTCSAVDVYTFTAADVAAGGFTNTATATGSPFGGTTVVTSNSSATTTTLEAPSSSLTLSKSVTPASVSAPGTQLTYDYTVTNTGNQDISTLAIAETAFSGSGAPPSPSCPVTSLAPGTSTVCTAPYTVTQADLDRGSVVNTAHATGDDPSGATVSSPPSTATSTVTVSPAITLRKSVTPDDSASFVVGQELTYSFVATNTGNVTLTDVGITETNFSGTGGALGPTCPASAPIPPGAQVTCSATYTLTQADIDNGEVVNTATTHGTTPTGGTTTSTPSTVSAPSDPAPSLTVQKTATPATVARAGDVVDYQFAVVNTGNVTLKDITVAETAFSGEGPAPAITCPAAAAVLLPGAMVVCTASYTLTQLDADQPQLTNTADATGTPPSSVGGTVTSPPSTAVVTVSENAALSLVKTASPLQATSAGDTITYSFAVTNTGDSTVHDVSIVEGTFSGTGGSPQPTCPAGAASLAPGATVTCTASYTVTQADADSGMIDNTATADGTSPSGATVTSPESQNSVPIVASPSVTLQKTASVPNATAAGETVTYSFLVTNTGNVTLLSSALIEGRFTGRGVALSPVCPPGIMTLAPGASVTCTADYTVTQADMDAGVIENLATVSGRTPTGDPITTPPSQIDITAQASPSLTVQKSVSPLSVTAAGQAVTYSYLITNTGNVTLTDVTAVEGGFTGSGPTPSVTCPPAAAALAPGGTVTCTATYTATQEDVDTGTVTNTATAWGNPPRGEPPVPSSPSTTTFSAIASPELTIVKSADPATISRAGQLIAYTFVVTNTGNVTMFNVEVAEGTFTGTGIAPVVRCPAGPIVLAPGDTLTCTATYTATQEDVDAGGVQNSATPSGGVPSAPGVAMVFDPSDNSVTAPPAPALSIVKSATPSDRASFVAGARIDYTFVVTNTGNVTLDGIRVADSGFTGTGTAPTPDCPAESALLAPGDQLTCTAVYTVTQADVDAGGITNTATASGIPPTGGEPVLSDPSTVTLPHDAAPALRLVKTAMVSGTSIDYRFAVTNTGNVTVTDVTIVEGDFTGTGAFPDIACPEGAASLAPGEAVVCTASYALTGADRRAGSVTNTATARGDSLGGPLVSAPSTARAALAALASTGLQLDQGIWFGAALLVAGAAVLGIRILRRRRS